MLNKIFELNTFSHLSRGVRSLSSAVDKSGPSIFVSKSTNPYLNLSLEDWLFRKSDPSHIILFLYRNTPSVIIGRNQNPWKEINFARLKGLDIPFVRRRSGGGTVYHDLGNTNYCIFVPRTSFDRKTNATLVSQGVRKLGIPAYVNERNDICVEDAKVSGSAFKLSNQRAYHHGTMLIEAQLSNLRGLLKNQKTGITTKGVASVSSKVANLEQWSSLIDHDTFVEAVIEQFANKYKNGRQDVKTLDDSELRTNDFVKKGFEEMHTWEWQYGQTPEFSHDMVGEFEGEELALRITSKHGLITHVEPRSLPRSPQLPEAVTWLGTHLVEQRYGELDMKESAPSELAGDVLKWIEREMQ